MRLEHGASCLNSRREPIESYSLNRSLSEIIDANWVSRQALVRPFLEVPKIFAYIESSHSHHLCPRWCLSIWKRECCVHLSSHGDTNILDVCSARITFKSASLHSSWKKMGLAVPPRQENPGHETQKIVRSSAPRIEMVAMLGTRYATL